jgi:hypothetical protein
VVGFAAYINVMYGSRSKITIQNLVRQYCAEGFNSGVKGLIHTNVATAEVGEVCTVFF